MIVVSDTTPLISLMKIGHLDLLEKYFGEAHIPEAVFNELTFNSRFADEAKQIEDCAFIHVVKVQDYRSVEILRRATGLDIGESEAIVLSDDMRADLLLMDEAKGRDVAEQMGIRIMGTIGLLIASYQDGSIGAGEIRKCVEILRNSGRHIGEKYFQTLLERIKD